MGKENCSVLNRRENFISARETWFFSREGLWYHGKQSRRLKKPDWMLDWDLWSYFECAFETVFSAGQSDRSLPCWPAAVGELQSSGWGSGRLPSPWLLLVSSRGHWLAGHGTSSPHSPICLLVAPPPEEAWHGGITQSADMGRHPGHVLFLDRLVKKK